MTEPIVEHLGDGAYITYNGYEIILTANHHDPMIATDTVRIDEPYGIDNLKKFLARIDALKENKD